MKQLFIAGNWKSNKTTSEANEWLQSFKTQISQLSDKVQLFTIVLCAPTTLLAMLKQKILADKLPMELGAQNISPFPDGAYTGEVSARMIKDFADWVIIGHSERRKYFGETDEMLVQKVKEAKSANLRVIYCIPDDTTMIPKGVDVVAYEPVWAIGTGKTDTPENANSVITNIKAKSQVSTVIYGGSVIAENVASFAHQSAIDGVLLGGASLEAETFMNLIENASAKS